MKINTAVICAAGFGSRLGLNTPKCLVPIGKHKLIYYLLELLEGVSNVRVVVGYKEQEVIDYVKQIRMDVLFVRNPNYATTSNSYSLHLGSKDLKEPFLSIDGDLIIEKESFQEFINECKPNEDLLGVSIAKTDDAVFTRTDENDNIIEFSREKISDTEWSGLAYFANVKFPDNQYYVYEQLIPFLPVKSKIVTCWEIDTPNDLSLALKEIPFLD